MILVSNRGWTANYDMGYCPKCGEEVTASIDSGKYYDIKHYCPYDNPSDTYDPINSQAYKIKKNEKKGKQYG